jgi:hypothetical protein
MATTLAVGTGTLSNITSGTNNLAVGNNTALNITTGSGNIYLGNSLGSVNESNTLRIGTIITGNTSTNVLNALTITNITLTNTTNQMVLGTTNTTTINSVAPASSQTVIIPDQSANLGASSTVVLTSNTITYMKTGTYTVTIGDGTNNFTLSSSTAWFSVIGDTVNFWLNASWTSKGSATAGLPVVISLPFTPFSGGTNFRGQAAITYAVNVTYTGTLAPLYNGTAASMLLVGIVSAGTPTVITVAGMGATGQLIIGGAYRTS